MGLKQLVTPDVLDSLYRWLCQCAQDGHFCPTNQNICDRYGFKSWSTSVKAICTLQERGLISVMRYNRARQVYIVKTQRLTPLPNRQREVVGIPAPTPAPVADSALQPASKQASDLPKPTQPSAIPLEPRTYQGDPATKELNFSEDAQPQAHEARRMAHASISGRDLALTSKPDNERADELRQMADFEKSGKVKQCRMGETAYEQDENGLYINPKIRRMYQSSFVRARRANRAKALAAGAKK